MILMIDNYDSFTYNLVQMFQQCLGDRVQVCRNDHIDIAGMEKMRPSALIVSPGPCTPAEAGISVEAIRHFGPSIPVLGVCLGQQSIAAAFGGRVIRAGRIMHGKVSPILHTGETIYEGLPNPFNATRYHSLIVERESLPACLKVSAWTAEGEIMGLKHCEYNVEGVQFHPESILTNDGMSLIQNFIRGGNLHD